LAAADEAIGLTVCGAKRGAPTPPFTPGWGTTDSGAGIVIASPQEGQVISVPAPELSTANS
jgi:hypothetical protein